MNTLVTEDLENVFVDVRKAYRLLYLYQRRVLDTIKFISTTLDERGITGYSVFSETARDKKPIDFECWAWDWLPMFCYEFKFDTKKDKDGNTYDFAIAVYADNGFEDAKDGVLATDVEQFLPVEQSHTNLIFYVGKNMWKEEAFDAIWCNKNPREYKFPNGSSDTSLGDNRQFLALRFPLSKFKDEDGIIEGLREFKTFCHAEGMTEFLNQEI